MTPQPDWYDSEECRALTREYAKVYCSDGLVRSVESADDQQMSAVQLGYCLIAYGGHAGEMSAYRFRKINPVLAVRLIRERIEHDKD